MKYIYPTLNWVFGLFFLLLGSLIVFFLFWGGLSLILIALFLLPPVRNFIYVKTKKKMSTMDRGLLIVLLSLSFLILVSQFIDKTKAERAQSDIQHMAQMEAMVRDWRQSNIDYFSQNSVQILQDIESAFQKGNYKEVVAMSSQYLPSLNQELIEFHDKAKSKMPAPGPAPDLHLD